MEILKREINDFQGIKEFSTNIVRITQMFRSGVFDKDNKFCHVQKIPAGNIYNSYSSSRLNSVQIYNNFADEPRIDWGLNFITFYPNKGFEIDHRNSGQYISISSEEFNVEDYIHLEMTEECYFQLSTLYNQEQINSLMLYAELERHVPEEFYLDMDYYDLCLEKVEELGF